MDDTIITNLAGNIMRKILSFLLLTITAAAFAGSTINPSQPAANSPLSSAPLRANFTAAYTDVNNILGQFAGSTAPLTPSRYQYWLDTTATPGVLKIYDGTSWVSVGKLNSSAHTWSPTGSYSGSPVSTTYGGTGLNLSAASGALSISSGIVTATTLPVNIGGTGLTTYSVGDLVYASNTSTLSKLADIATGNTLLSGGVGVAPSWGKVALTTHVSGTLPVANGGTNSASASGTALDNITGFSSTGFLTRTGSGAYAFQSATNGITLGNFAQIASNTVVANATSATATVTALAVPSCSTAASALNWTTNSGFGCNTSVTASNLTGAATGTSLALTADFSANGFSRKNLIINGGFTINQRGYASAGTLASGSYGHDRWKGGSGGGNYTFTQLNSNTQITIAANKTLIQVVENKNVVGGTYILSWSGTCTGRYAINSATPSGSYAASPIVIAGQTAGTTMSVEFGNGASTCTLGTVQLETGTATATAFEFRSAQQEQSMCQRYYAKTFASGTTPAQNISSIAGALVGFHQNAAIGPTARWQFPATMSGTPTITTYDPYAADANWNVSGGGTANTVSVGTATDTGVVITSSTQTGTNYSYIHATAEAEL